MTKINNIDLKLAHKMTFETWTWIFYSKEVIISGKVKNPEEFLILCYIMAILSSILARENLIDKGAWWAADHLVTKSGHD